MSKITKKELRQRCIDNETAIASLESILKENGIERQPQLKQLDQSIFNGLDEKWRFAAVDADGTRCDYETKPRLDHAQWACVLGGFRRHVGEHDASNWQNSLIERDTAKELLEVDFSSELTGSDLARAMLARGDKYVMCRVSDMGDSEVEADIAHAIRGFSQSGFKTKRNTWSYAVPINNQGEPLTQAEAGL